jgi:hypothetical protein
MLAANVGDTPQGKACGTSRPVPAYPRGGVLMGETRVRWHYACDVGGVAYSIGVARYLAEQVDGNGYPLIGGIPLADERIGPPRDGFRRRSVTVSVEGNEPAGQEA